MSDVESALLAELQASKQRAEELAALLESERRRAAEAEQQLRCASRIWTLHGQCRHQLPPTCTVCRALQDNDHADFTRPRLDRADRSRVHPRVQGEGAPHCRARPPGARPRRSAEAPREPRAGPFCAASARAALLKRLRSGRRSRPGHRGKRRSGAAEDRHALRLRAPPAAGPRGEAHSNRRVACRGAPARAQGAEGAHGGHRGCVRGSHPSRTGADEPAPCCVGAAGSATVHQPRGACVDQP
jgi:hypothetical protein